MHLVFVTSLVPHERPSTGYEIANAAIIGALRRAGVRLTVLGYSRPDVPPLNPDTTIVLGEVEVNTGEAGPVRKLQWLGKALTGGHTFSSAKLTVAGEQAVRNALAGIGPFDGFVLNAVQMAGAFPALFTSKPFIYVAHNVEHASARENAAAAQSTVERLMFAREARLLEKLERRFCSAARFVFTLAEEDSAALGVESPERSAVLPMVTREKLVPLAANRAVECDAALIGTWSWAPNRIGLDWFLNEVIPLLPQDFTVCIAGNLPDAPPVAHPGVSFVGRVPDAQAFMASAAVAPLISRAGTGVQLKTIETFEMGLPSVATASSLRGIAHLPNNCRVHDDPAGFAAAMIEMAEKRPAPDDGRRFHAAQLEALDERVRRGLQIFSGRRLREDVA